jgi:acyl-coenzyme A synthetase/AMP-(fatty) acid ligase
MVSAKPYMMYGLTEAFRSCYLPPEEIDKRPGSFGRAIPNAEVMVLNKSGQPCAPFEKGELVHRGVLVAKGYWNDSIKTAEKFRPFSCNLPEVPLQEKVVWSGDIVHQDDDGYFYFHGREDDLIKSSGYRISPQEIEDVLNEIRGIKEAIIISAQHPKLGAAIIAIISFETETPLECSIRKICQKALPNYMIPHKFVFTENILRNANGKYHRRYYQKKYECCFKEDAL